MVNGLISPPYLKCRVGKFFFAHLTLNVGWASFFLPTLSLDGGQEKDLGGLHFDYRLDG